MSTPSPSGTAPAAPQQSGQNLDAVIQAMLGANQPQGSGKPGVAFGGNYGPGFSQYTGVYQRPSTKSVLDMTNEFYGWDDAKKGDFRSHLALISKNALTASDDDLASAWGAYVQQSANYLATGQSLTPWDIMSKDVATNGQAKKSLAGTKKSTTSDASLTSKLDAAAIFKSAAQTLLGRAPTAAENAVFQKQLNTQESANPVVSNISTTTNEEGDVTNTSRTSTGGLGQGAAALIAENQAKAGPEYGAYQAATTYMNALLGMIK